MDPASDILRIVRSVIGDGPKELQRPPVWGDLNLARFDNYRFVDAFEAELQKVTKAKHVIALTNGTAALYCALMAAGVGEGDEVLCPSLTYAATANAIVMTGAVPHFIDVHSHTLGVHPFKLRQYLGSGAFEYTEDGWCNVATGALIAAIVPVHLLGIPCEVNEICLTADYYGIKVIEDACEALGSRVYTNDHCGLVGLAGALSFNLNKIITTGGGGCVLTNDDGIADRVRHFSRQGKLDHPFRFDHDQVGFDFMLPPMCASLGLNQLSLLPGILEEKVRLANRYAYTFGAYSSEATHVAGGNRWLNAALLHPSLMQSEDRDGTIVAVGDSLEQHRDRAITALLDAGYGSRAIFTPLHLLPHFARMPRQPNLAGSEDLFRRLICLPSSVDGGGRK